MLPSPRGSLSIWTLPFLVVTTLASAQITDSPYSSASVALTCPYRTINYITHSLPQQCLASTRTPADTVASHSSQASLHVSEVVTTQTTIANDESQADWSVEPSSTTTVVTSSDTAVVTPAAEPPKPDLTSAPIPEPSANDLGPHVDTIEEDSALESGNFLSFEEWKRQNLQKAGQSEHIAHRNHPDSHEPRQRPAGVHNSLESLGDDGEIDLDFSGFVPGAPEKLPRERSQPILNPSNDLDVDPATLPKPKLRSRDAGTTCKERFNYASFDCAANVLKINKEAKSPHSVLLENKDSYMLNQCSAPTKFIILELCNDILIDTVVLANFEFFSSTFRTFRISVSDRYPVKVDKWKTLGNYEARNTREVQAFLVENPLIWARYLRIEFLSHYGNEFYCPVSLVRVHGTTMMEDYKHDLEMTLEDDNDDPDSTPGQEPPVDSLTPEAIAEPLMTSIVPAEYTEQPTVVESAVPPDLRTHDDLSSGTSSEANLVTPAFQAAMEAIASVIESSDTCIPAEDPLERLSDVYTSYIATPQPQSSHIHEPSPALSAITPQTTIVANTSQSVSILNDITTTQTASLILLDPAEHSTTQSALMSSSSIENTASHSIDTSATTSTTSTRPKGPPTGAEKSKASSTTAQAPSAVPSTQESFFKSVQKRLHMLEANSSLSLQYIEDQSRALRDAFKKVEQRQLARTSTFLHQLNQTVLHELREFREQYDQLWQSTVIELGLQRERYERDNAAINARIGILADEVIFQRRMAILQMILILVCLVLVIFSRGSINNYLELPIVQNVLGRSPSSRWLNLSSDTLNQSPEPKRPSSAHELRTERSGILKDHRRVHSEDSITDTHSGNDNFAPPTPVSDYGNLDIDLSRDETKSPVSESDKEDVRFDDPEFDPNSIERPATSPPTLQITSDSPIVQNVDISDSSPVQEHIFGKAGGLPNGKSSPEIVHDDVPTAKRLSWRLPES